MTTSLTSEQEELLAADFNLLKKNAKGTKDICNWFKKNPALVPNLSPDLYSDVKVFASIDSAQATTDYKNKTIYEELRLEFLVNSVEEKEQKLTFNRVTGLKLGRNSNTNPFFQSYYTVKLDALEWPFVALDILSSLDDEELKIKDKQKVFANLLETHFPQHKWETFIALFENGLLPEDPAELRIFLKAPKLELPATVPADFAM